MAWDAHLKSKRYLSNKPDQYRKICAKCNIEVRATNWSNHLKSKNHLEIDSNKFYFQKLVQALSTIHKTTLLRI